MDVVTGAFGYTGSHIAARLLAAGKEVRTVTGHPHRPGPFGGRVRAMPFDFDKPERLVRHLEGADTLYNTYWIRFERGATTFERAVRHSRILVSAARKAGVRRIVHVSITNPSLDSDLPYFRGKAEVERAIVESSLSHAILRPAVFFGDSDVLVNNVAWAIRRFPFFVVPGDGKYALQPIHVDDFARLAVEAAAQDKDFIRDAAGPEAPTFDELLRMTGAALGKRVRILHAPPKLGLAAAKLLGAFQRDVMLTSDEVKGLAAGLLVSKEPPLGKVRLSEWMRAHAGEAGARYSSEIARHFR